MQMSQWPSTKGHKVFKAFFKIGWQVKKYNGSSHIQLVHPSRGEFTRAFRANDEIGPVMLARIAKHTGLKPQDL
jgi:predicted RNA binding protein YcfA (HicA-like mRNA interferase family)